MKKITIQFTRSTKRLAIFSWLIRAVQRTPYSHVRIKWVNSTQTPLIYEASGTHVRFIGPIAAKDLQAEVLEEFTFLVTKEEYYELVKICMTYAGVKYSFKQVANIGFASLGIKWKPFAVDNEYAQVCSELVARVLHALGIDLKLNPDKAGPKEIFKQLKGNSNVTHSKT